MGTSSTERPTAAALAVFADIERAADELFVEYFGVLPWDEPEEAAVPHGMPERYFESVSAGAIVGFAKVIEAGEYLHLEQLSVHPKAARSGRGAALVARVLEDAQARGFRAVSLRTFAEVPWNAPFYQRRGFRVIESAPSDFHAQLERTEEQLGLLRHGARVHMLAELR